MAQENPSISNGEKKVLGFKVKTWVKFFIFLVLAIIFVFAAGPFIVALILHTIYPDKDYSEILGMAEGLTFIIGILGTIASVASIFMTILDRTRYDDERKLAEEQRESVKKIGQNIDKMGFCLERFESKNTRLLMKLLKKEDNGDNFFDNDMDAPWGSHEESNEEPSAKTNSQLVDELGNALNEEKDKKTKK